MPDKKLTDNEIKKALEICGTYKGKCTDCPAFVKVDRSNCKKVLLGALDIINRQNAENEQLKANSDSRQTNECENIDVARFEAEINRLQAEKECLRLVLDLCKGWEERAKAEAYKEFVERLHKELCMYGTKDKFNKSVFLNVVDKAKKELVGEGCET